MSKKEILFSKMPLALIFVLVISVIWPNSAQATTIESQKSFSTSHNTSSVTFIQEVDEDERVDQDTQLLAITIYSHLTTVKVSYSTIFAQQAESLFFRYLFSNITTQAP